MTTSTTNTAARELLASALDECGRPTDAAEVREGRNPFVRGEYALAAIEKSLTQQQGGEQETASGDAIRGLRDDEGMLSGAELESLIDAAQTTSDSKAVAFLGQVARDLLQQLHGVESVLLAVGKRPPLCDTKNAVRFAVGMPFDANGETE